MQITRIIDVGCGSGTFAISLASAFKLEGTRIVGIDNRPSAVAETSPTSG